MNKLPEPFNIGALKIYPLRDGGIKKDGASVFGMVPKIVWSQEYPADESNRVTFGLNCLLVQSNDTLVLIGTGIGTKSRDKAKSLYSLDDSPNLIHSIEQLGFSAMDISYVLLTHLHFDTAGGLTYKIGSNLAITFPAAEHIVHKDEWAFAHLENPLIKTTYNSENYDLLYEEDRFTFLTQKEQNIIPGISMRHTGGHSAGHCIILIEDEDDRMVIPGDLIPTRMHVRHNWTCGFDWNPYDVAKEKLFLLDEIRNTYRLLYLSQEPFHPLGYVHHDDNQRDVFVPEYFNII